VPFPTLVILRVCVESSSLGLIIKLITGGNGWGFNSEHSGQKLGGIGKLIGWSKHCSSSGKPGYGLSCQ